MKVIDKSVMAAYIGACILCGLVYLLGPSMGYFGKRIVGWYGLALLAATLLLAAALLLNRGRASWLTNTITSLVLATQFPIMYCWAVVYSLQAALIAISAHCAFCGLGIAFFVFTRKKAASDPAHEAQF